MWCQRAALPAPAPGVQLQISLIDNLDAVLDDGGSRSTAEYAVAAVRSIFPIYSGNQGGAADAVKWTGRCAASDA